MNLLLDTNVWLWALYEPHRLSPSQAKLIQDPDNGVFVSSISLWEFTIKRQIGKLPVKGDPLQFTQDQGFEVLAFAAEHAVAVEKLPMIHRDPFDRALLAQALVEGLNLLSSDQTLQSYGKVVRLI